MLLVSLLSRHHSKTERTASSPEHASADLLVRPLSIDWVAALEVEPGVGLAVVNLVEGVGDGRPVEVAAGGAELVDVVVVRGAAVGGTPDGL